ncbi:hypothetical protein D3C81_1337230 [compost metagenome]
MRPDFRASVESLRHVQAWAARFFQLSVEFVRRLFGVEAPTDDARPHQVHVFGVKAGQRHAIDLDWLGKHPALAHVALGAAGQSDLAIFDGAWHQILDQR